MHTHMFPRRIAAGALRAMQGNCHTALFSDGTEDGLIACERRAKADLAIVQPVATNPDKVARLNDSVLETNRRTRETGLLSFGAMHPACADWERELERLKQAGVAGIKLHPAYAGVDTDDPRSVAILRKCRDLGLIVLMHGGRDVGLPLAEEALPAKIRRALDAVGPLRLVVAHMGGWGCWAEARALLSDTGVYIDTAFSLGAMTPAPDAYLWRAEDLRLLDGEAFCELVRAFGADHVLFGTDGPWADPEREIAHIRDLPLPPAEIGGILGENARALLGASGADR